jgi:hypothetical protein
MKLEVELWQLIVTGMTCIGFLGGIVKMIFDQFEKRQNERAAAQDSASHQANQSIREALNDHLSDERRNAVALQTLEREFMRGQADLPVHYVRREDYVRGQSILEAKLDATYSKLETLRITGAHPHG